MGTRIPAGQLLQIPEGVRRLTELCDHCEGKEGLWRLSFEKFVIDVNLGKGGRYLDAPSGAKYKVWPGTIYLWNEIGCFVDIGAEGGSTPFEPEHVKPLLEAINRRIWKRVREMEGDN